MRAITLVLLLFQTTFAFSQTKEIVGLLNKELAKEIHHQKDENYSADKFDIVHHFSVKDSLVRMIVVKTNPVTYQPEEDRIVQTNTKILSVEIRKKNNHDNSFYTEKQEIDLHRIKAIAKDIHIMFETEENAVTITSTEQNGEKKIRKSDLFFLYLSAEKHNEYLADEIVKLFKKAAYPIEKGSWYD